MTSLDVRKLGIAIGAAAALVIVALGAMPPDSTLAQAIPHTVSTPTGVPTGVPTGTPTGVVATPIDFDGVCLSQARPVRTKTPPPTATPSAAGYYSPADFVALGC